MTDATAQCGLHWDYFLALEEDLAQLSRYIELHEDNFATYSIECARLLGSSCAEVEAVLKLGAGLSTRDKFKRCFGELGEDAQQLVESYTTVRRGGLVLFPWAQWSNTSGPDWWEANNQIKHGRSANYRQANLGHAVNALAGLFSALLVSFRRLDMSQVMPAPHLFRAHERLGLHCMTPEGPIIALDQP